MHDQLGLIMEQARRRVFVGREDELRVFAEALEDGPLPFHVLAVQGPAGVGKTYLLQQFQRLCRDRAVPSFFLNARDISNAPETLLDKLAGPAEGEAGGQAVFGTTQSAAGRRVVFLDEYETLAPSDAWIRTGLLPSLSASTLVVLSGKRSLPAPWHTDPGLSRILRKMPLRNLTAAESREYLRQCAVPDQRREALITFAHGHPLALSLLADASLQHFDYASERATPDIIALLLDRFLQDVPSDRHRLAIEAASVVNVMTEGLLAAMLGDAAAHDLFSWLQERSFVECGARGIFPHDIVRQTVVADLKWRDPERFATFLERARRFYTHLLSNGGGPAHEQVLTDYMFAHRHNPLIEPYYNQLIEQWGGRGALRREEAADEDYGELRAIVERHEGEASAKLFSLWAGHPACSVQVFRNSAGKTEGLLVLLSLEQITAEESLQDPATAAAKAWMDAAAPLRGREKATLFRWWMSADAYQAVSPAQSLIFVHTVRHYLTTPALACTFLPCARPSDWQIVLGFADLGRLPDADFRVGSQTFGVFMHDWRAVPPGAWLERVAGRAGLFNLDGQAAPPEPVQTVLVLSKEEFAVSVKEALKTLLHDDALLGNPLLHSRLVLAGTAEKDSQASFARTLRELVVEEVRRFGVSPGGAKLSRAIHHTYIEPSASQEQAAATLGVPYSTFRRHLSRGIDRLVEALWQRELRA